MASIFCSKTLTALLGHTLPHASEAKQPVDRFLGWNATLFSLGGRKCVLFTNKATFFSCLRLNVLKKDLADFGSFFQECLMRQLRAEGIAQLPLLMDWVNAPNSHSIFSSDNDRSVIGTMNNTLGYIKYAWQDNPKALTPEMELKFATFINAQYLTGALKNRTPMDEIARLANGGIPVPRKPIPAIAEQKTAQATEPMSEIVRFGAEKLLQEYCEFKIPAEYRYQARLDIVFEDDSATIMEHRAEWPDFAVWTSTPIARFRYNHHTARWSMYWADVKNKWHLYDEIPPGASLDQLIDELHEDPNGVFWG